MAILEEIGKRISDVGQNVVNKGKNLAGVTQLNSAISDKEKKISQLYMNLGQLYYEKHKDDEDSDGQEMIREISSLKAQIDQNKDQIRELSGVTKCPKCGADVPAGSAFCSVCGAKIESDEPVSEDEGKRFCPVCHATVSPDAAFCTNCGAKLDQ